MNRSTPKRWPLTIGAAAALAALLAGCGGDNAANPANGPGNTTTGTINSANASSVVRVASDQMMSTHMLADFSAERGQAAMARQLASTEQGTPLAALSFDLLSQLIADPELAATAQATPAPAGVPVAGIACSGGGTVAAVLNDADNNLRVTSGDSATFTLTNCVEQLVTASGTIEISNLTLSGDPKVNPNWSFGATLTFTSLVMSDRLMGTVTANGAMGITWSAQNALQESGTITIDNLSLAEGTAVTTFTGITMTTAIDRTNPPARITMSMDGNIAVPNLGTLTIDTVQPIERTMGTPHPIAGAISITLNGSSKVVATTLDGSTVRLDVYAGGGTTPISTQTTTWEAIHSMTGLPTG